jgi:hypothetical protein
LRHFACLIEYGILCGHLIPTKLAFTMLGG